jgi:hypothetical protein
MNWTLINKFKMKILLSLFILFLGFSVVCQNQYLVEYDRINDTEKYFELKVSKGVYTEIPISKPSLKNGDMIRFRGTNVNPLVFTMKVRSPLIKDDIGTTADVLSGFSDILGKLNGPMGELADHLSSLSYNIPEIPNFKTRGGSITQLELRQMESMANLVSFHAKLTEAFNMVAKYQSAANAALSISMTKEEILQTLRFSLSDDAEDQYRMLFRTIEMEHDKILKDSLLKIADFEEIESAYQGLSKVISNSWLDPSKKAEMIAEIESADFTQEKRFVIGYDPGNSGVDLKRESGVLEYTIEFLERDSVSEFDYDQNVDHLIQNHNVKLSTRYNGGLSWATGGVFCAPFDGFRTFTVQEMGIDSSVVIQNNGPSGKLTLGTSLLYSFPISGGVLPHVLFGSSIAFANDGTYPINFLFGGGLRLKQFQFVSFAAGISFCQNRQLQNGIETGRAYSNDEINTSNLTRKVYSPGYFVAINFNL